MYPMDRYFDAAIGVVQRIRAEQADNIRRAAQVCADVILRDRLVHLFGAGHSRIPVEEMFPRYGSFPGFHPIVELSMTYHHEVVGANGQRQAMFIENVPGLASRILRNFALTADDAMVVFSTGGTNIVPIEIALEARETGMTTIAVTSLANNASSRTRHAGGKNLAEVCDIVVDNCVPPGDAVVWIEGLEYPVSPVSTLAACAIANAIKAEVAELLTQAGKPPFVLTSPVHIGAERSQQLFDETYDDYRRRVGVLYG
ncbi:SIS domain-containing protein [Candidatus Poribacteria bacterium]|nr:SIS domain-containing protein [Candidatus Poribacteria bacterium]